MHLSANDTMYVSLFIANFFCGWKDNWKPQQWQPENGVTKVEWYGYCKESYDQPR